MGIMTPVDKKVLSVPINECGEPLVDIKNTNNMQYGQPPECKETAKCYTMMRQSVYTKLLEAQSLLPGGLKFRLYEGLRSIEVQNFLFENELRRVKFLNPLLSDTKLHIEASKLISPVINLDGSKNIPPHSTGAAVDVEIIDCSGQVIDCGMEIKDWKKVPLELCFTDNDLLSDETRANKSMLSNVMKSAGFVNYPGEWWHWSYGDRYWAYNTGNSEAIYGTVVDV